MNGSTNINPGHLQLPSLNLPDLAISYLSRLAFANQVRCRRCVTGCTASRLLDLCARPIPHNHSLTPLTWPSPSLSISVGSTVNSSLWPACMIDFSCFYDFTWACPWICRLLCHLLMLETHVLFTFGPTFVSNDGYTFISPKRK